VSLSTGIFTYRVVDGFVPVQGIKNLVGGEVVCVGCASRFDAWLSQGYDCLFHGVVSGYDEPPTTTLDKREDRNLILLVRSPTLAP